MFTTTEVGEEIVQLQHLDQHEDSCGFTPAVCTNPGCGATLNKRDLTIHESELCEYRKLKCHSCRRNNENVGKYGEKNNKNRDKSGECSKRYGEKIRKFGKEYGDKYDHAE